MNITVLFGGPSAEREVSLVSGRSVIEGLKSAGHEVFASDVSPSDLSALNRPADVIFPVLHGQFGESGELQEILEQRGLCFVGSGSAASRAGMNKDQSKKIWKKAGLPLAPHELIHNESEIAGAISRIGERCVVKPTDSGSSLDVFLCKSATNAEQAAQRVIQSHGSAMIEKFIPGQEFTVGIFEERALSPIRITTKREFFDYQAKYTGGGAEHHFELNLPADVVKLIQQTAEKAHQAIGCRDLSRIDIIVDAQNQPWILEINTMPGFTPRSLLPEAAGHDGIPFPQLVDRLVRRAHARSKSNARREAV
jgi:D-alanine-D-alanine ligase